MITPAHLGGHQQMTWVDEPVLDYLTGYYHVKTMLDVGCGLGGMIDAAAARGIDAIGIDGDPQIERPDVITHDYATDGPLAMPANFDLIWCVEFVEHVRACHVDNFLTTFDAGRVIFLTHALPGQRGHHHVNERFDCYWIDMLAERGWRFEVESTIWVRIHGAIPFSRISGLVLEKTARSS